MIVERIHTAEGFAALRDEWNALLAASSADCVFLTHEWLATWWKHLGEDRRLWILSARENEKLIGIFPLALRKAQYARMTPPVLEFIASGVIGSDYLDIIAERGREADVCRAFARELNRSGLMLQLSQLRRSGCTVAMLEEILKDDRWAAAAHQINVCPFIDLKGHTWETYLQTLGSSQRYNFNRRLRNLMKQPGWSFECARLPHQARPTLDSLIELHRKRWGTTGNSEAFQTPAIVAFHHEFAKLAAHRGWMRLMTIRLNDATPVAALYGLHYGQTFYFYQSGFDPAFSKHSVGLVMMGLAIKTAAEEEVTEYDLLHGAEEYKFHWTSRIRELGRLELYPPHSQGRIFRRAIALNRAARQMAKRVLRKA